MKSGAHVSGAGTPGFGYENESSVEGGVIKTFKSCGSYFVSELFRGVCESMHTEPICFRDSPPGLAERRGAWTCG